MALTTGPSRHPGVSNRPGARGIGTTTNENEAAKVRDRVTATASRRRDDEHKAKMDKSEANPRPRQDLPPDNGEDRAEEMRFEESLKRLPDNDDYAQAGTHGQFQPGLMNRALSNGEMFRQVQTMPVTAYDPRPRRSQELMEYVSEGTEGQWKDPEKQVLGVLSDEDIRKAEKRNPGSTTKGKRPRISMGTGSSSQAKAASTRRSAKSLAPKSPGEQTETGRQIEGALSGIGQGLATLFSEKPAAPQQERPVLPMDYVKKGTEGQFNHEAADKIMPQAERQKWAAAGLPNPPQRSGTNPVGYVEEGTHGQDWDLIRLGMDAQEQDWHGKSKGKPQKPAAGDSTWREWASERSKGSREHFDAGHT